MARGVKGSGPRHNYSAQMTLEGGLELERLLVQIEPKLGRKAIREALQKGFNHVLIQAKANARSMIGGRMGSLIADALYVRPSRWRRKGFYGVTIIPKKTFNEQFVVQTKTLHYVKAGKYAGTMQSRRFYIPAAIEYGHAGPGRGGTREKVVPAKPYIRAAFHAKEEAAFTTFAFLLNEAVVREWQAEHGSAVAAGG